MVKALHRMTLIPFKFPSVFLMLQSYFSRGGAPFIGMIVSPYDPANPSPHSQTTCLLVKEIQEPSGPRSMFEQFTHTHWTCLNYITKVKLVNHPVEWMSLTPQNCPLDLTCCHHKIFQTGNKHLGEQSGSSTSTVRHLGEFTHDTTEAILTNENWSFVLNYTIFISFNLNTSALIV